MLRAKMSASTPLSKSWLRKTPAILFYLAEQLTVPADDE
jgi:hypothetical protein